MNNMSKDFGLFLDNLRSSRNMSREDFVDGVLSTRQYQRYLKGEASISNGNFFKLVDNLELEFFSIFNKFQKLSSGEHNIINQVYYHITSLEFKEAYTLLQNYKDYNFTSLYYKKLYDLYVALTEYKLKRISGEMAINHIEKSINYPSVLDSNILNFIEVSALIIIVQIQKDNSKIHAIMSKLYTILKYNKLSDFDENDAKLAVIYSAFSKALGSQHEYDKALFFAKKGIILCEHNKSFISLSHLYYYSALAYMGKGNMEDAYRYAKKTFFTLEIENNSFRLDAFIKLFESHFKISYSDFKTW